MRTPTCALVAVAFAVAAPAAAAATPSSLTLSSTSGQPGGGVPVVWSGTVLADGPRAPAVPECAEVACDRLRLDVRLDGKTTADGQVHVAIRFINGGPEDNLQLAIYRKGKRVGASTGAVGTAQSVMLKDKKDTYDVFIVDGIAYGSTEPSPEIAYEGLAQYVTAPEPKPHRRLLPDLVALPQKNVTFGPPFEIFNDPVPPGSTCHQSEIDELGAHTCLRFDQVLGNIGEGSLDIRFSRPAGQEPVDGQEIPVVQRLYRSQGGYDEVPSGDVHWHAIHEHYHFDGFAQSVLWRTDAAGHRAGTAPIATGDKVSFCISTTNISPVFWTQRGFGSDDYPAPTCLQPYATNGGLDRFKQGMSVGWTDTYDWFLPGQYIEVTGVPDGDYILETKVDPTHRLTEADQSNNCSAVRVRLSATNTALPQAELLGPGPAC